MKLQNCADCRHSLVIKPLKQSKKLACLQAKFWASFSWTRWGLFVDFLHDCDLFAQIKCAYHQKRRRVAHQWQHRSSHCSFNAVKYHQNKLDCALKSSELFRLLSLLFLHIWALQKVSSDLKSSNRCLCAHTLFISYQYVQKNVQIEKGQNSENWILYHFMKKTYLYLIHPRIKVFSDWYGNRTELIVN